MKPITKIPEWLIGRRRLPAGALPLATETGMQMICLMPTGRWIRWWPADSLIQQMPPDTQKAVMLVLIEQLGGSTAKAAEKLGVSTRTVEAWRQGKNPLPIGKAYEITELIP